MAKLKKLTFEKTDAIQKKLDIGVADEVWPAKRSASDSQSGLAKSQKITDAWTRATPSQTKIPEKQPSVQTPEVKQDSRSQWTSVGGGRKSTTDAGKTPKVRKFSGSTWAFDYEADPAKVAAAEKAAREQPGLGTRLAGMAASAGLREASNLTNAAGVKMDKQGGTAATEEYQDQLEALNRQITAAENQLRRTDISDADRRELQEVLQAAQQQRQIYEDAVRANQQTGEALYGVSDEALEASQKQDQKNTQGLGSFGKSAVELGTGLMQVGMEGAAGLISPVLGTTARVASVSGAASGAYRRSTDDYDVDKAQRAGTVAGAGVLAGSAISNAVGSAGLGVLKALGKQNNILPNILTAGASGAGYAAGETGMGELSKALTYDDYEPDWNAIGTNLATSFAFSAMNSAIGMAQASKANKAYAQQLNSEVQKRYEQVQQIMQSGNAEQRAQGAASVMDGVDRLRRAVNDMHLVGAQKEVTAINRFLNSIDAEMAQYLPNGATVPAGALTPGTGLVPPQGAALMPQQAQREASAAMSGAETSYAVPPVDTVAPGSYNKEQKVSPAASPEVRQMETQAQVSQAANPESKVLDAAATLFVEQGVSVPKALEKAEIVHRLVAGEEVGPREINKLNPTSKATQAIFTQLTGVQFPDAQLSTEQLFGLYRSAHEVALQAEAQIVTEATVPEVSPEATAQPELMQQETTAPELQVPETGGMAVDSEEGREAFPGLNRLFDGEQTLTQQMADSGFQANPETQERIAQAQAELADAVNGTQTAASRKSGSTRNEIQLPSGETLTREDFKAVARENYGQASDSQLDAMFNGLLARTDRGETIPGLEDVAQAAKERRLSKAIETNMPAPSDAAELREESNGRGIETGEPADGDSRLGFHSQTRHSGNRGNQKAVAAGRGGGQEVSRTETQNRGRSASRGEENRKTDSLHTENALRSDSRDALEGRGSGEIRGGGSEAPRDGVLRANSAESGSPAEGGAGRTRAHVKEENNGRERRENLLHGGLRGESGSRTGKQSGRLSEGAEGTPPQDRRRGDGRSAGVSRVRQYSQDLQEGLKRQQQLVAQLKALKPKTYTLRLGNLKPISALPNRYLTPEMKRFSGRIKNMGGRVVYCTGPIRLKSGDIADGLYEPDTNSIIVRVDTQRITVAQTQGHEAFHFFTALDSSLQPRVFQKVMQTWGLQDMNVFDNLLNERYGAVYSSVYRVTGDQALQFYYEEFLADLHGGIYQRLLGKNREPNDFFRSLQDAAQSEVRAWEREWDAAHPTTQQNTTASPASQDSTEKPSFSLASDEDDFPDFADLMDPADLEKMPEKETQAKYNTWRAAYDALEYLPMSNLAFDQPPIPGSEVSIGCMDDHGNWIETLKSYPVTPEGLEQLNADLPDFLNTYNANDEDLTKPGPEQDSTMDDGYGYNYEDEFADDPDEFLNNLSDLYAKSRADASNSAQTNREGFTRTDTKAFKKWFRDPSGEFTNPDGQPKVFMRGTVNAGATKAHDAGVAKSKGIFFTTVPDVAAKYAFGVSSSQSTTLMDAVRGNANGVIKELKRKYFRGWGPAKDFIAQNFQTKDAGLRLVGITHEGNVTDKLASADHFSLQTNVATLEQFETEGRFAGKNWRELATFPNNKQGLEDFNYQLGDVIRDNSLGIRGYGKYYLSGEHPLVIDAARDDYHGIRSSRLPAELQNGDTYTHINDIAGRAFKAGYDSVIVKNVDDAGGLQDQYIVKNSSQVKSVYNKGNWSNNNPDFLFSLASDDDHKQKLESFFKDLEDEYGEGSAEAMFETFEQLDRARKRAEERAADAEAAQQAAEWAADAAVEAAKMAEQAKADRRLQKQRNAFQEKARQAAAKARLEKANAVRSARLAEQMNAGKQWSAKLRRQDEKATAKMDAMKKAAQERLDQLRAGKDQDLADTRTAERMNAGKRVAAAKRKGEEALAREKARRAQDHKLAGKDAKTAASVLRKYHKKDTSQPTNVPTDTLREAYHAPTIRERAKIRAEKWRADRREFYKAFINGTQAIDDFSKYQKVDANTSVLLRTAMASNSTVQGILQNHLVGKDGSVIDDRSLEDVVICWDGSGKHRKYNDDKQRILQDYMLHRHNIDRMSFRGKAQAAVEAYEQSYPWLTTLEPREFAELVADDNRIAQRYQELIENFQRAKNKPIFQDKNGSPVTADYSRSMVEQYEQKYDWVKDKAEGIYDWWDKFMQEWVVGETISPEEYATLRETYPSYVPTYRKDKAGLGKGVSAFGGTVTAKRTIREATGGTSPVANIEDSFVNLMEKNVKSQRTNMVLRSITDTAMLDDDGDFNGFTIFDWDDAPEVLRWGLAAEGFEGALEAGTDKAAANALSKEGGVCKIRAWANGERVSAYVDPELYDALEFALNPKSDWLTKVGRLLSTPMKTAITGINPGFAIRNMVRDNLTAQMNSISTANRFTGFMFEKYYARAWKEMVSNSENWQHFVDLGGTNAGYYNNEGGSLVEWMRKEDAKKRNPIRKAGAALSFIGENTESVTRFAEYLATIDILPGGDTYGNRLVGIKNAAEVTVDFSRKGTKGATINAWIPYWNPGVQGIDKMVRSFFEQPDVVRKAKALSRALLTTLPLDLILLAVYKHLEREGDWEELSDRTKDTYYCIPLPSEHKFLKLPKSRDWGQLLSTPIMRAIQGLNGRENPFEDYFTVSFAPNFLWSSPLDILGYSAVIDLAKNEDFAGRPIVPSKYVDGSKGAQWDSDTSKFSKGISDIVNALSQKFVKEDWLSPMQLDYLISATFGSWGDAFIRTFSIGGFDPNMSATQIVGTYVDDLMGSWTADNRYSSASVSDYYDLLDKIHKSIVDMQNEPLNGRDKDWYKDAPLYKLNSALNDKDNGPSTRIADLNAQVRELPDGEEKDNIKGQIVEIAREALQMYDAVQSGELQEPKLEMQYSKYGEQVCQELISLKDYAEDYSFLPSNYKPKSYTDPKNKKKEYVLDEAAQEKYRELYDEEYRSVMEEAMKSSKYKSGSLEKRAELLEAARDDVASQVKDEFLKWLGKNYKSTDKKK